MNAPSDGAYLGQALNHPSAMRNISIRGARTHNLKNIDLDIPRNQLVVITGLSGSGKTKLAQAFALWICESEEQYKIIPVGADWTNREPLLGYPNALEANKYVTPENGALDLINRARLDITKPYFLILDEMNLSHVERYFADFLSTMESGGTIPLHNIEVEEYHTYFVGEQGLWVHQ